MLISPSYASVTVELIVGTSGDNENLERDFVGGDGGKTLGDALHGIILWRKANIKLIRNRAAPMDPRSPPICDNDDHDSSPEPPSAPSPPGQKARSTPTPPAQKKEKKKTSSLPLPRPTNKKQKTVEKKIGPKKKLAYEMTQEETREAVQKEVIDQFKPKVPEKKVAVDPQIATKVYACLNNPPPQKKVPLDYDRTLIKAHQQRNKKCGKTVPQLGTQ
jgi:hypothetical protein